MHKVVLLPLYLSLKTCPTDLCREVFELLKKTETLLKKQHIWSSGILTIISVEDIKGLVWKENLCFGVTIFPHCHCEGWLSFSLVEDKGIDEH